MIPLNLPAYEYKLSKSEGKIWIFDILRKKHLVLTPEEWVRQHFINHIITTLEYPRSLIKIEGGLAYNQLQKRTDIVVFDRDGKPWMVIECKAPAVELNQNTLHQASTYNATLRAKYLVVTNGLQHFYFETDWALNKVTQLEAMPVYLL
jgi:hypothetical protein